MRQIFAQIEAQTQHIIRDETLSERERALADNVLALLAALNEIERLPSQQGITVHGRMTQGVDHSDIVSVITRTCYAVKHLPRPPKTPETPEK